MKSKTNSFVLAIVIPYYKKVYFEETLQSLAKQTNNKFKIYIGDDASPDDPTLLINSYRKDLNITYKRFEKNLGRISLTQQWRRCIELIEDEEWIMVLGDDDYLAPNVVESFYDNVPGFINKTQVVRYATQLITENPRSKSKIFTHPIWEEAPKSFQRKIENKSRSSLSEYIFSVKTYSRFGFYPYPLGWHSDDRAWLEFSNGKPIYSINSAVVYIRNSPFNISSSRENLVLKLTAKKNFLKFLIQDKINHFPPTIKIRLLRDYEETLSHLPQGVWYEWICLYYFYIKYSRSYHLKKFVKRRIKNNRLFRL